MKHLVKLIPVLFVVFLFACGSGNDSEGTAETGDTSVTSMVEDEPDPMQNKGIGPVSSVVLEDAINEEMAASGQTVFNEKCTACHKPDKKHIGPAPKGILDRRSPEWVMNMILNPEQMVKEDPLAKELLLEFNGAPMANQHLTEKEARAVLEYFRTL